MAITYEEAPDDVLDLIHQVMIAHHADLHLVGVTVSAVMASKEEGDDAVPALKTRGQVIAAKIQITSLVDRARGLADAKLTICQYTWDRMPPATRLALLDHELTHLELVRDKDEQPVYDDRGRPKLKTRHHDWELTGFVEVAARHREASVEVRDVEPLPADGGGEKDGGRC